MSEWLTQLNDWILQHSALIVSAGLPIFGAAIAAWQAYLNYRLKKSELRLQARMMLAEQRLKHFENLRETIEKLLSLLGDSIVDTALNNRADGSRDRDTFSETLKTANAVLIHTSLSSTAAEEFTAKFSKAIDHVHLKDWTDDSSSEFVQLRELCGEVLRAERNRLESDFEEVF